VLRFKGSAARAKAVAAPRSATIATPRAMDPQLGYLCPLGR
jgi:hypothetical protein